MRDEKVSVPVEPTEEMLLALAELKYWRDEEERQQWYDGYKAMLAAAPHAESAAEQRAAVLEKALRIIEATAANNARIQLGVGNKDSAQAWQWTSGKANEALNGGGK